jgi:hypothetical protein
LAGAAAAAIVLAVGTCVAETSAHAPVPEARPNDELIAKLAEDELRFQDYDQAALVLALKDAPLAAFREKIKARNDKMAELDKSDEAKKAAELRAQLKAASNDSKKEELSKQLNPVAEVYDQKRSALRAEVFAALSADQQKYWIGWVLFRDLSGRYRNVVLSGEQKDKLWKACGKPAGKLAKADALKSDPYLRNIKDVREELEKDCTDNILTSEQRSQVPKPGEKGGGKQAGGKSSAKKAAAQADEKK